MRSWLIRLAYVWHDPPSAVVAAAARARQAQVGYNNPPPQPTSTYDVQQCHEANHAAELATARAIQVLHLAKVGLHQLVNSYNPRAAPSGGTDGSSKRRKTSRGADASGSRSGSKGLRHFSMKVGLAGLPPAVAGHRNSPPFLPMHSPLRACKDSHIRPRHISA